MVYPYIPHTEEDRKMMLSSIGLQSIDQLFEGLGEELQLSDSVPISHGRTEDEVQRMIDSIAQRNVRGIPFLGCGCYDHIIPATVKSLSSLPSFVTAYTPYQAEMSQGLLQAIYEFQSMICEITGMDVANASLYDGAGLQYHPSIHHGSACHLGKGNRQDHTDTQREGRGSGPLHSGCRA